MDRSEKHQPNDELRTALKLAGVYALVGGLWIWLSSSLLPLVLPWLTREQLRRVETFKGWMFIAVTTGVLFLLLRRHLVTVRRSQQALSESELRLKLAAEASNVGLFDWDLLTNSVHFSAEWKSQLGYAPDELPDQIAEFWSRLHPDDRSRLESTVQAYVAAPWQNYETEFRLRHRDGTYRWILTRAQVLPGPDGKARRMLGCHIDLTQRRQVEERLRFTQNAVDHAGDAVYWLDEQGKFFYVNEAACRALGYGREELLSMDVFEIDPDLQRQQWGPIMARLKSRRSMVIQTRHRARDGRVFPVEVTASYMEQDGRSYSCTFVRDLTERKQLEQQLLQSQKMEAIGRLAGGIAHDFNNLLAVIGGYAEAMQRHTSEGEPLHEHAVEIEKAAQRGAALTRQLLAFGRRQALATETLDLNQIISGLLDMLQRLLGRKIRIRTVLETGLFRVLADRSQMEQVIVNLSLNGRDAMPEGGELTIATSNKEVSDGDLHMLPAGSYVCLVVRDTGIGMDAQLQSQIFEPFFTTKGGKGTGLGLSIVYGIAQQAGGGVYVRSEPGKGAEFQVLLPAQTSTAMVSQAVERA